MTVGELIVELSDHDKNAEVTFGALSFYRLKLRGDSVAVEFNETVRKDETCRYYYAGGNSE